MTTYRCEDCDGEVRIMMLPSMPPKTKYSCTRCGKEKVFTEVNATSFVKLEMRVREDGARIGDKIPGDYVVIDTK